MATHTALQESAPKTKGTRSTFYRPELDTLRFFAFLAVFVNHALPTSVPATHHRLAAWFFTAEATVANAGVSGVDLFFVLSAYLITELLLREKEALGTLNVRAFYLRRILRIWPLYFFVLPIMYFVPVFNPVHQFSLRYVLCFLFLAGNWSFVAFGWPLAAAGPLWSISVEEQFYLVWAPVVAKISRRQIAIAAGIMILIANVTRIGAFLDHSTPWKLWPNTLAHLDSMGAGILLAAMLHGRTPRISQAGRIALIAFGVLCLAISGYLAPDLNQPLSFLEVSVAYPAVVIGCAAIMVAFLGLSARSSMPEYLGKISYGLYVYHLMCIFLVARFVHTHLGSLNSVARIATSFALTLVIASTSYTLLEKPFLKLKSRFTYVNSRPV